MPPPTGSERSQREQRRCRRAQSEWYCEGEDRSFLCLFIKLRFSKLRFSKLRFSKLRFSKLRFSGKIEKVMATSCCGFECSICKHVSLVLNKFLSSRRETCMHHSASLSDVLVKVGGGSHWTTTLSPRRG